MRRFLSLCLFSLLLAACAPKGMSTPIPPVETNTAPVFTPIPTLTPTAIPTDTPYASLGTIALDFIGLLCNAEWMNGAQHLTTCPAASADHSGGFATLTDPIPEGLPAHAPVLLTIPPWNGYGALFLRYPSFTVGANDRFRSSTRWTPHKRITAFGSRRIFIAPCHDTNNPDRKITAKKDVRKKIFC